MNYKQLSKKQLIKEINEAPILSEKHTELMEEANTRILDRQKKCDVALQRIDRITKILLLDGVPDKIKLQKIERIIGLDR